MAVCLTGSHSNVSVARLTSPKTKSRHGSTCESSYRKTTIMMITISRTLLSTTISIHWPSYTYATHRCVNEQLCPPLAWQYTERLAADTAVLVALRVIDTCYRTAAFLLAAAETRATSWSASPSKNSDTPGQSGNEIKCVHKRRASTTRTINMLNKCQHFGESTVFYVLVQA